MLTILFSSYTRQSWNKQTQYQSKKHKIGCASRVATCVIQTSNNVIFLPFSLAFHCHLLDTGQHSGLHSIALQLGVCVPIFTTQLRIFCNPHLTRSCKDQRSGHRLLTAALWCLVSSKWHLRKTVRKLHCFKFALHKWLLSVLYILGYSITCHISCQVPWPLLN